VLGNQRRGHRRLAALRDRITHDRIADASAPVLPGDQPLAAALRRLRPSDREALLLVAWEELSSGQRRRRLACGREPSRYACTVSAPAWSRSSRTRLAVGAAITVLAGGINGGKQETAHVRIDLIVNGVDDGEE
jgi:hypothetical protein